LIDLFPEERGGLFYAEGMAEFVAKARYLRENVGTVSALRPEKWCNRILARSGERNSLRP